MNWPDDFINKVICGDCLKILPQIPDGVIDAVITDPPYGIDLGHHVGAKEKRSGLLVKRGGYLDTVENFNETVVPAINKSISISKRAVIYCVPPNMWKLPPPNAIGGIFVAGAVGRNKWGWSTLIHCLLYGTASKLEKGAKPTAIRSNASAEKTGHPTTKPIEWMRWSIALASEENDIILDPFAGSGTTLVAAKQLGRRYIGIEISPEYCKIAEDRLRQGELF